MYNIKLTVEKLAKKLEGWSFENLISFLPSSVQHSFPTPLIYFTTLLACLLTGFAVRT
jgi:hypothetical protein